MSISRLTAVMATAVLAVLALGGPSTAVAYISNDTGLFNFCDPMLYDDNFIELRRGAQITPSTDDLGNTDHCALNFTGAAGSAGDTWITRFSGEMPPTGTLGSDGAAAVFSSVNGLCIQGDVLTSPYNNAKGAGLVGLLGTEGGKGLFALLVNNGNTDKLTINTIDPGTGKIVALGSVSLGSSIHQNVWYRVVAFASLSACDGAGAGLCEIASGDLLITATVYAHETPTNPDSELVTPALGMVEITRSLSELGINAEGFVGMAGWAKSSPVNSSITNFRAFDDCGITVK